MANFFPRWTNLLPIKIAICVGTAVLGIVAAFSYYATDKTQAVGYMPDQPIPYDHELHVNQLGLDCRYCHSFADETGQANIPSGNVCWSCHEKIKTNSPKLEPLRRAMDKTYEHYTGEPVRWVKVYNSPDYVYFDHSAHLNRGISCVSCHGQVDQMRKVYRAKAHTMAFCLDCHRAPEKHLRPNEEVTNMKYTAKDYLAKHPEIAKAVKEFELNGKKINSDLDLSKDSEEDCQKAFGLYLKDKWNINPKVSCATCHN